MSKLSQTVDIENVQKPKGAQIHVRVTKAEKRKFEKLADSKYMNLGALIRQVLHREADQLKQEQAAA